VWALYRNRCLGTIYLVGDAEPQFTCTGEAIILRVNCKSIIAAVSFYRVHFSHRTRAHSFIIFISTNHSGRTMHTSTERKTRSIKCAAVKKSLPHRPHKIDKRDLSRILFELPNVHLSKRLSKSESIFTCDAENARPGLQMRVVILFCHVERDATWRTLKLQDWTLTDHFSGVDIAGLDIDGRMCGQLTELKLQNFTP